MEKRILHVEVTGCGNCPCYSHIDGGFRQRSSHQCRLGARRFPKMNMIPMDADEFSEDCPLSKTTAPDTIPIASR